MANFLLICDPDASRRNAAARQARDAVAFLPRLRPGLLLAPHHAIAWAAAEDAPVARQGPAAPDRPDCLLFGEPHGDDGRTVTAADLARSAEAWDAPRELNGYYAAVLVHPHAGVRVEADVLGMFPIYYWQSGDVLLVGSSPGLFRCHPAFYSRPDLHGVAALLLTSGLVGGRTLWQGVRRLAADHTLIVPPGQSAREIAPRPRAAGASVTAVEDAVNAAAALHEDFLRASLRHSRHPGLLLSGGLDSRLLAGFVTGLGHRPKCLTFGHPQDLDAACATQVARALDLPQTLCDVDPQDYAAYARSSVAWEQLSGGLYALPMGWNLSVRPPPVTMDRMVCGLTLDAVIGGPKHVAAAAGPLSFEQLRIGRLGFDRAHLDALIGSPELAAACDAVRHELVETYRAADPADHLREWRMNLAHRHRFAVGACAWRYSLFAWPVMPALDRRLIDLAARLPHAVVRDRQVQTRMLITRFPPLARLDLDRNYLDTIPLLGARRSVWFDLRRRAVKLGRRALAWAGRDPRFYVRTMEFNSPGWRVVRSLADEARPSAEGMFRRQALARAVPPAGVRVRRIEDPIIHSTPLKNTLGLLLWLRQHA
jgi:asparagine synthase (glutamine-hydrolysing)